MNLSLFVHVIFLFLFCLVLAAMEVQIEGAFGWAKNLPTWRAREEAWYAKLYGKAMGGKELTGYHLMIFSLVFLFLHYPFFTGIPWTVSAELTVLSFFFIVTVVWDFLWFVVNPHYDFLDFWARQVWWHKKWFWHLPYEYWFGFILSVLLYVKFPFTFSAFIDWLEIFGLFLIFAIAVMLACDLGGVLRKRKKGHDS